MIHDGDYYSIVDKDKILSLLDDIEQNIILFTTEISLDTILCFKIYGPESWYSNVYGGTIR